MLGGLAFAILDVYQRAGGISVPAVVDVQDLVQGLRAARAAGRNQVTISQARLLR